MSMSALESPSATRNGASEGFEWKHDYYDLLAKAAEDNLVQEWDWVVMCDALKFSLHKVIGQFLEKQSFLKAGSVAPSNPVASDDIPGTPVMSDSPTQMTIAISPSAIQPRPSTMHGLIIPPFPPRPGNRRVLPTSFAVKDANDFMERLFGMLDDFEDHPPFTIQRICELLLEPFKFYKSLGKFLRAFERTLLVTSTADQFSIDTYGNSASAGFVSAPSDTTLRLATTPLFSPIPFLHPEMDPITGQVQSNSVSHSALSAPSPMLLDDDEPPPPSPRLGLVDEMDDPDDEQHMADHPKAISSTTEVGNRMVVEGPPLLGSSDHSLYNYTGGLGLGFGPPSTLANTPRLEDRFVRSSTPEPEAGRVLAEKERVKQEKEDAQKRKSTDDDGITGQKAEGREDMALDSDDLGEGKENIMSQPK